MKEALQPRDREIVALVDGARGRARRVALFAAEQALDRHGIADECVRKALATLRRDDSVAPELRSALGELVDSLDAVYWNLSEKDGESGHATLDAFSRARAANALLSALQEDACEAAVDAIYEAHASLDDHQAQRFLERVKSLLRGA